ncbi:MAG: hypothetical protein JXR73_02435 [Candidatus Omnitrophica bacterium]|nr:hypothetical protein [Candidatus Omnitrophota bacterium]
MIDINKEVKMHVGDRVSIEQQRRREGSIEAIRVISDGKLVENFCGLPDRIVVTVNFEDSIVNKRGFEIIPLS